MRTAGEGRGAQRGRLVLLMLGLALLAAVTGIHRPAPALAAAGTVAGQNLTVIDGDTLQSGGDVLQLYGIDAREVGQLCEDSDVKGEIDDDGAIDKLEQTDRAFSKMIGGAIV
jgi:endonuclease YncB( thermonuclease family)